jgi:hypothetical protein
MNKHPFSLDFPLMTLHSDSKSGRRDYLTIRNAVENIQIFGSTGSGKSSGSGEKIAVNFLKAGFGGIVLTVKLDERDTWEKYCREANRLNDLIVIGPGENSFDFIQYESLHKPKGLSITDNVVDVLRTTINAGNDKKSGHSGDAFWLDALDTLLANLIDLSQLAYGFVTIQTLYDLVQSIPKNTTAVADSEGPFKEAITIAKEKINLQLDAWEKTVDTAALVENRTYERESEKACPDVRLLKIVDEFFTRQFIPLAEKTKSIVSFSFTAFLSRLIREPIYSLLCGGITTVTPEDCMKGKIVLIDLPVKFFDKAGRDAQIILKYCFQRAFERRTVDDTTRPLFIFADESQHFIHEHDATFQTTSRSSRVAVVYLTQNLPNYYANMGGDKAEENVKSFLGNFNTKIFHANADIETNKYASELLGDVYEETIGITNTVGQNMSRAQSSQLDLKRLIRPETFARLLTGGPDNKHVVEAIFFRQGKPFSTGRNAIKVLFKQTTQK